MGSRAVRWPSPGTRASEGFRAVTEVGVAPRETLLLNSLAQATQVAGGVFPKFRSLWWEKVHLDRSQAWKPQPCPLGTAWACWEGESSSGAVCLVALGVPPAKPGIPKQKISPQCICPVLPYSQQAVSVDTKM